MRAKQKTELTLALSGLFQAASLVSSLAKTGKANEDELFTCLNSIFVTDPENIAEVYGSVTNLRSGLYYVDRFFQGKSKLPKAEHDVPRYAISLIMLHRRLAKDQSMLAKLSQGIERAKQQKAHFGLNHTTVIGSLADLYSTTLSTYRFRIQVTGNANFLQQHLVLDKVRALLLAGIRSAVLWRQLGGKLHQLFILRRRFGVEAEQLLQQLPVVVREKE